MAGGDGNPTHGHKHSRTWCGSALQKNTQQYVHRLVSRTVTSTRVLPCFSTFTLINPVFLVRFTWLIIDEAAATGRTSLSPHSFTLISQSAGEKQPPYRLWVKVLWRGAAAQRCRFSPNLGPNGHEALSRDGAERLFVSFLYDLPACFVCYLSCYP